MAMVQKENNIDPTSITVDNYDHRSSTKKKNNSKMYLPSQGMLASDGSYYIPTRPIRGSHVTTVASFGGVTQENSDDEEGASVNEGESAGKSGRKRRRKSIVRRMWRYVKESWLGVMSGTGKGTPDAESKTCKIWV
jgi:hypothetical protein